MNYNLQLLIRKKKTKQKNKQKNPPPTTKKTPNKPKKKKAFFGRTAQCTEAYFQLHGILQNTYLNKKQSLLPFLEGTARTKLGVLPPLPEEWL